MLSEAVRGQTSEAVAHSNPKPRSSNSSVFQASAPPRLWENSIDKFSRSRIKWCCRTSCLWHRHARISVKLMSRSSTITCLLTHQNVLSWQSHVVARVTDLAWKCTGEQVWLSWWARLQQLCIGSMPMQQLDFHDSRAKWLVCQETKCHWDLNIRLWFVAAQIASDHVNDLMLTLRCMGELSKDHSGTEESVVGLCNLPGRAVIPCIHVTWWVTDLWWTFRWNWCVQCTVSWVNQLTLCVDLAPWCQGCVLRLWGLGWLNCHSMLLISGALTWPFKLNLLDPFAI